MGGSITRPLRVLQVSPAYAPSLGGVETCVREISGRLLRAGAEVQVLTADPSHTLPVHEMLDGVPVRRVRAWPRNSDQRFAPGIGRAVAISGADVVHVQCYQTLVSPLAMFAARRSRLPYVLTLHEGGHSGRLRSRIRGLQLAVLRPLLLGAEALVATAEWEIDHYASALRIPRDRFRLIPNGGDLPALDGPPQPGDGTLIVSLGRAERYKGHHLTLAAMPQVIEQVPDARLWVAGEGAYAESLRREAERLGISGRVEIGAEADRLRYARRLSGAAVATLLSEHETAPMAALETISLGIPTLVADNSGLAELAGRGWATAVGLAAGSRVHADRIIRLIREPPVAATGEIPDWDECAGRLLDLYAAVTDRHTSSRPAR